MAEVIDLEFRANVADVKKKLKELPKETAEAAAKAVKEIAKALKQQEKRAKALEKAEKKATKAAKDLGKEAANLKKKGKAGFESLKQAATGAGGAIGAAGGQIEALGRAVIEAGGAFGPMGVAVAGVGLSLTAMAFASVAAGLAVFNLVNSADDWLKTLDEAGASGGLITDAQREALEEANVSIDAMWLAAKRVGAVFAVEFADGIRIASDGVIFMLGKLEDLIAVGRKIDAFLVPVFDSLGISNMAASRTAVTAAGSFLEESESVKRVRDAARSLRIEKDDLVKTTNKMVEAAKSEVQALDAITRAMAAGRAREAAQGKEFFAEVGEMAAAEMALDEAAHNARMTQIQMETDLRRAQFAAAKNFAVTSMAQLANFIDITSEQGINRVEFWEESAARAHAQGNETKAKADQKRADKQKKQSLVLFKTMKALQIAGAIQQTAMNALALIPFYVALGPGAIPAAAATAGAGLAVQIATINQTKPPTFAAGGVVGRAFGEGSSPDHVTIQADPREGIVNPRGMAALGEQGLDALNRGGGMGGPMTVVLNLDGQTLAAAVLSPSVKRELVAELRAVTGAGRGPSYGRG